MDLRTAQALIRFGLGRRGEEPVPADPAAWLLGQLHVPDPIRPTATTERGLEALRFDRQNKPPKDERRVPIVFREDARAALDAALTTSAPFRERLVWFWTNHFTVSVRGGAAALCGAFVAEAIRPHVTGRFEDMLMAVMHHPAMLIYLNNAGSVGPDSPAGQRTHRGLNENLARECMELHTVSPASGYTQADVTNFAKILTGWSINFRADPPGFTYRRFAHEPGWIPLMGHQFPPGEEGGMAALRFLANHPSTQRFLATRLVQYFVADSPSPATIRPIEAVLRDTGGNLGAAAAALVRLDAAWHPGTKLREPQDYVIAGLRMLHPPPEAQEKINVMGMLAGLGQPLWSAPQPDGWPDRAANWAGPEEMMRRIDWAYGVAGRVGQRDPGALAQANLGPLLRPATWTAVMRSGSRRDAMTMFLGSPEFQRR
ncbi:MAG TPA: DUF1800 domain-containing protein [Acetobacteraceae bacterium]|jgi:uncharacterized protein (DUF1800 family)